MNRNAHSWDHRLQAYGRAVVRFRWLVIAASLGVIGLLGAGTTRLVINDDYRLFFSDDNPQLQAFEAMQNIYAKNDNILFVVTPEDGEVFSPRTLAAIEELTTGAWQIPFVNRVDSVTNFQHTEAEGDDLIVEALVEGADGLSPENLERVRAIALAEPLLAHRLVSPAADITGVNAVLQMPRDIPDETQQAAFAARQLAEQVSRNHPGIEVRLTGFVFLNNAFKEASLDDLTLLMPLMYLVIVVFLALLFRSFWATFATVVVIITATVGATGAAGWLGTPVTSPMAIAPTLILTLAVADSIHLLKGMLVKMRQGMDKIDALIESLRVNAWPIFLTSATTAIGFLSMNFSDAPPFQDLGNTTSIGVSLAFLISMTLLPALISILPLRAGSVRRQTDSDFWRRFADHVITHRRRFLWGGALVVMVFAMAVPRNVLNDQFVEYFAPRIEFRRDTDYAIERLTGIYQVEYSLEAGDSGGISEPEYLAKLDAFADWWRQQPGVVHVRTLADTMKRINRSMHGDDDAYHRLPEERDLAAQYLLLYEMSLPYGLDLNDEISIDKSATRFSITFGDLTARELIDAAQRGEAWLRDNAPPAMHAVAAGPALMFAHLSQRNIRGMLTGTLSALVLISFLLIFALRSLRFGLLSLVPNLAPAALAFGIWGLIVAQVNIGLSMVLAMTLGIVVDDSVHFLAKYLRGRRERGYEPPDAVRYAFESVGGALWTTSAVLTAGFIVLSFSAFDMNAGMGRLTAITIVLALVTDFLLLPALLLTFDRRQRQPVVLPAGTESASVAPSGAPS